MRLALSQKLISGARTNFHDIGSSWWVDDTGRWRSVIDTHNDVDRRDPFASDLDKSNVAYRFMGMVRVKVTLKRVQVSWDVNFVQEATLYDALKQIFYMYSDMMIELCFYFGGWRSESYYDEALVIRRVKDIQDYKGCEAAKVASVREYKTLQKSKSSTIYNAYQKWARNQNWNLSSFLDTNENADLRKSMLVVRKEDRGAASYKDTLTYEYIGQDHFDAKLMGHRWVTAGIGTTAGDWDYGDAYCNNLFETYEKVLKEDRPCFQHVLAHLHEPQKEAVWATYQHIMLPTKLSDGSSGVMSIFDATQDIDIPFMQSIKRPANECQPSNLIR